MRSRLAAGGISQRLPLGEIDAQGLFGIGVLAGIQRLEANGDMGLRDCQIDDDLDRGIGKQRVDAFGGNIELGGLGFRKLAIEIGHALYLKDRKRCHCLQIGP
jgi:hypothetical protein